MSKIKANQICNVAETACVTVEELASIPTVGGFGFRNKLINGCFRVSQRGNYAVSTPIVDNYMLDRWQSIKDIVEADLFHYKLNENMNYRDSVRLIATTSGTGYMIQRQIIEFYRELLGRTVTVSCRLKTNMNCGFRLDMGTGGDIYEATTVQDETWHDFSATFTIPLNAERVFVDLTTINNAGNTNERNIDIGDYFEVGDFQLEIGSVATPFEERPIGYELSLCQRYYEISDSSTIVGIITVMERFTTTKRAGPTVTLSLGGGVGTPVVGYERESGFRLSNDNEGARDYTWTADAEL